MSTITRLLIARHGNTFAAGEIVRRVGVTDLPLVDSGLQQGRLLGTYLKQQQLIPDVIFTSQLKRTMQTAMQAQLLMGTDLPLKNLSIFNEIDYGPDENQPEELVIERVGKEALLAWENEATVPEGWNGDPQQIIHNCQTFADDLIEHYLGKTILVVTSNGIARFAPYLTGDFKRFTSQHKIKIATGAVCLFENKSPATEWQCIQWNIKL